MMLLPTTILLVWGKMLYLPNTYLFDAKIWLENLAQIFWYQKGQYLISITFSLRPEEVLLEVTLWKLVWYKYLFSVLLIILELHQSLIYNRMISLHYTMHFITYQERNPCKFGLCMPARLLNIQIGVFLQGDIWTTHKKYIDACKLILIHVGHSI